MKNMKLSPGELDSKEFLEYFLPGDSEKIQKLRQAIEMLNNRINLSLNRLVLITGEPGVGKSRLARIIAGHRFFIEANEQEKGKKEFGLDYFTNDLGEINITTLPSGLWEATLFGYKKGAFTDAKSEKKGLLESEADNSYKDILLDEIGDAPLEMQAKLLQVVEDGNFYPVGAEPGDMKKTTARLIFSTNKDLWSGVKNERFREDLYWRLDDFSISMPALRDQKENIPRLITNITEEFFRNVDKTLGTEYVTSLPASEISWAKLHNWPGNIRQLKSAIRKWLMHRNQKGQPKIALKEIVADQDLSREEEARGITAINILKQLENNKPLGSLDNIVQLASQDIRQAVVSWYEKRKPTSQELEILFPDMKPSSAQNKISEWKRKK